jgi:hypothetical protein
MCLQPWPQILTHEDSKAEFCCSLAMDVSSHPRIRSLSPHLYFTPLAAGTSISVSDKNLVLVPRRVLTPRVTGWPTVCCDHDSHFRQPVGEPRMVSHSCRIDGCLGCCSQQWVFLSPEFGLLSLHATSIQQALFLPPIWSCSPAQYMFYVLQIFLTRSGYSVRLLQHSL